MSILPVEPKLGKMLIYGAIFNCLDPILTVVAGLSVRDPFLAPFDKKDVSSFWSLYWPMSVYFCTHGPLLIHAARRQESILENGFIN